MSNIEHDPFAGSETSLIDSGLSTSSQSGPQKAWATVKSMGRGASAASKGLIEFGKALREVNRTLKAMEKMGGTGSAGPNTNPTINNQIQKSQQLVSSGGSFNNFMGGFTGQVIPNMASPGGGMAMGTATNAVMGIGSATIGAIDSRTNQMYGKALSYDKLSVLYQQTQNVSQQQFVNRFVNPLMNQRLGTGGAATLLGLQAQTGLNANLNASSVAAMQAATGYMYNTQDMARTMATLASPQINNRMTMTLGTGMYGPGGQQRNMMQVIQQVVRGSGLTNERMVQSGMQIGSITRAKLSSLGLPEDMQNMVLQYAQENINFQRKGGRGMYDPSRASDRRLMGIEENFSTQEQETQRARERRDLSFYKKQADNYSDLEKQTQSLTSAMQKLEESMSGLIGARMKTRNNVGIQAAKLVGGAVLAGVGAAISSTGAGAVAGLPIASLGVGLMGSGMQGFSGGSPQSDPMPSTGGGGNQRRVNTQMDSVRSLTKLNPQFRSRIERMLEDNPNVRLGDGHRDSSKQRTLFLSRYSKTKEQTGIFWEGSYWKKNPGVPDATPPGMSMHEVGLAVDLDGDLKWVQQHAAKYGLKTFANSGEPWHVQPVDLPNDRVAYEKSGARWGLNGAQPLDKRTFVAGMGAVGTGKGGAVRTSSAGSTTPSKNGVSVAETGTGLHRKPNKLSANQLVSLLYKAGFTGRNLEAMAGIATRETSGFNANALNPHGRDFSFGLYQINMKNDDPANLNMGSARLGMFGISKPEDLYNPETNIKAAKILFDAYNKNGNGFQPWLGAHNAKMLGENAHGFDYKKGVKVLEQAGWTRSGGKGTHDWKPSKNQGDPMPVQKMGTSGGSTLVVDGGNTITIAPTIQVNGSSTSVDVHKVAQEAARIIERDLKVALMRKN